MTKKEYHIWQKQNEKGELYWGVGNFCGMGKYPVKQTREALTELEWDGNEYYITDQKDLLGYANQIVAYWKKQMEAEFPETPFAILWGLDAGEEGVKPSVTLRFWAIRNGYTILTQEQIQNQENTWLLLVNEKK